MWIVCLINVLGSLCTADTINIHLSKPVLLEAENGGVGNTLFGMSMALTGDVIFIGAPKYSYSGGIFLCDAKNGRCSNINGISNQG